MSDKATYLMGAIVAVFIVLIVDFDAANSRWCATYPEWCEPVEITEVANYEDGENGYGN
jgi:hypothetical protein